MYYPANGDEKQCENHPRRQQGLLDSSCGIAYWEAAITLYSLFYEGDRDVPHKSTAGSADAVLTNASPGLAERDNTDDWSEFSPGDVMLITDNLNLVGMSGANPLMGPNIDELGPRFPDMSRSYDPELMDNARKVASENKISLREGVYCALSGPSFESPADLRFLHMAGADAVGMSTVPEVIVARHGGMRVLGFSGISNKANLDGSTITTHEEVIEAGRVITPKIEKIVRGVLRSL